MIRVIQVHNPFDLQSKDVQVTNHDPGQTVRELLCGLYGSNFVDFEYPTICLVNGEPWKRERWTEIVPNGAHVTFLRLAGVVAMIVIDILSIIISVVLSLVIKPSNPNAVGAGQDKTANGESVYTLKGQVNQNKLNNAIESMYGYNKTYPSLAAASYDLYEDNDQYQFSLFCLGHGTFKIEQLLFADTDIASFFGTASEAPGKNSTLGYNPQVTAASLPGLWPDVEYEIIQPGGKFTLFCDNVYTSPDVNSIELYGPNEDDFTGWTPGYYANLPYTRTNRIDIDLSLPNGLYSLSDTGKLEGESVSVAFQILQVDDENRPLGSWQGLYVTNATPTQTDPSVSPKTIYKYNTSQIPKIHMSTATPQRLTYSAIVPFGRYAIRAVRNSEKATIQQEIDTIQWDGMRAFFPSTNTFGDVTLVAVKAKANNILNDNSNMQFNVICTRLLPTWSPKGGWTVPIPTRNPVWAFCDIFKATYGAQLTDQFLDLESLYELSQYYETNHIYFDYIFDTMTNVWDAAKTVAKVGRAIPMLNGSQLYMVRDQQQTVPTAVFNAFNILSGSFKWELKLPNVNDTDGIMVQYVDGQTWLTETILCLIGNDKGNNPETVKLLGCTDRGRAYQEGLYMRAVELYCRENITFDTGLEGLIPRYGDMVYVTHDVPKWGRGGYIVAIADDNVTLTLSEETWWTAGQVMVLVLRLKDGTAFGPVPVLAGADKFTVVCQEQIPTDFYFDGIHEPPYYLFGEQFLETKECTIVGIQPKGNDQVTIQCVNYSDIPFEFSGVPTPVLDQDTIIKVPDYPTIASLNVSLIPGTQASYNVSWPPALGAKAYLVETSPDGQSWTAVSTQPGCVYLLQVSSPQLIYVRVAAIGVGQGPYIFWLGQLGGNMPIPGTVQGLALTGQQPGSDTFSWNAEADSDIYQLTIYDETTGSVLRQLFTALLSYTYTSPMAQADGLTGTGIVFRVRGKNVVGMSQEGAMITEQLLGVASATPITSDDSLFTIDTSALHSDHP